MQREQPGTKFKDIHDSKEDWFNNIEKILDEALVLANDDEHLQLRLLKPIFKETDPDPQNCFDFVLTPIIDVSRIQYMTVSYRWAQKEPLYPMNMPEYRIWDSEHASSYRSLRCPKAIFHCSLEFARTKDCYYIWIDQECINQSDRDDVEQHLCIMHRVYRESTWTLIPLTNDSMSDSDQTSSEFDAIVGDRPPTVDSEAKYTEAMHLMHRLLEDPWFTRTWTFQERMSASSAYILIPQRDARIPDNFWTSEDSSVLSTNDLCLNMCTLNSLYGKLPARFHAKTSLSFGDQAVVRNKITSGPKTSWDRHLLLFYQEMERCENEIPADRIAILGNSVFFSHLLLSNRLNRQDVSYMTCIFALLWVNRYPDKEQRRRQYAESAFLDEWFEHDVEYCLEHWHECRDRSIFFKLFHPILICRLPILWS